MVDLNISVILIIVVAVAVAVLVRVRTSSWIGVNIVERTVCCDFSCVIQGGTLEGSADFVGKFNSNRCTNCEAGYSEAAISSRGNTCLRSNTLENESSFRSIGYGYVSSINVTFVGDRNRIGYGITLIVSGTGGNFFYECQVKQWQVATVIIAQVRSSVAVGINVSTVIEACTWSSSYTFRASSLAFCVNIVTTVGRAWLKVKRDIVY